MKASFTAFTLAISAVTITLSGGHAQTAPPPRAPVLPAAPAVGSLPLKTSGAKIQFEQPIFDFGRVASGESVKHQFKVSNAGDQPLDISHVQTSCGCTTAGEWPHRLEPGQSGVIPVQFNSANFSGPVTKTVMVSSSDPTQPSVMLQIKGTVWKPIEVTPTYAVFNVVPDSLTNETRTVRIVNNLDEPITVSDLQCTNQTFQAELKTVKPGKEFEVVIKLAQPPPTGTVQGPITLKTSSTNMPVVFINTVAMVQPAVMVYPSQIMLSPGPLSTPSTQSVMVRRNGTGTLALSDYTINAEGVELTFREVQPGRLFSLMLKFPAGFQIPAGQKVELSVKSDHPQFSVIKVPVFQQARPAQVMIPPRPAAGPLKLVPQTPVMSPPVAAPITPKPTLPPTPPTPPASPAPPGTQR
jgi:hypothetical protein